MCNSIVFKLILLASIINLQIVTAQNISFEQITDVSSIGEVEGTRYSTTLFGDVDNDNDIDLLITGHLSINQTSTKLYLNDGNGNFTLAPSTTFDGVARGAAFSDIDNDNDLDLLITGFFGPQPITNQYLSIAKLYKNDGDGNFNLVNNTPFEGVNNDNIAFGDIDNDLDSDVIITGLNSSNQRTAKLYINDGNGNFTLDSSNSFPGVSSPSVAFQDIDNDSDNDLLITGYSNSGAISQLFINDGNGIFTLVNGTPFEGVWGSSIAFNDVDNDNDFDVLISGRNSANTPSTKLYLNQGNGNFSLVNGISFEDVWLSSLAFNDVDNDNDNDVLISGQNSSNQNVANLYENDGNGNFSIVATMPFEGLYNCSIDFGDIDNDNDDDICITGNNGVSPTVNFYKNTSSTLGLEENTFDDIIKIYPNPVTRHLVLDVNNLSDFIVTVTSPEGKKILEKEFKYILHKETVDFNDFDRGIYFLSIEKGKRKKTFKIIKQ